MKLNCRRCDAEIKAAGRFPYAFCLPMRNSSCVLSQARVATSRTHLIGESLAFACAACNKESGAAEGTEHTDWHWWANDAAAPQ